jgi:hypothetical protein
VDARPGRADNWGMTTQRHTTREYLDAGILHARLHTAQDPEFLAREVVHHDFWADPGHGWMVIPPALAKRLGITEDDLSPYSHVSRDDGTIYAEEDLDAAIVIGAVYLAGQRIDAAANYRYFQTRPFESPSGFRHTRARNYQSPYGFSYDNGGVR